MNVVNTSDSPVVIDGEGHTLGGGERADVKQTDEVTAALGYGSLVAPESEEPSRRKPRES